MSRLANTVIARTIMGRELDEYIDCTKTHIAKSCQIHELNMPLYNSRPIPSDAGSNMERKSRWDRSYDPRSDAAKPTRQLTWEQKTKGAETGFKTPQSVPAQKREASSPAKPPGTYAEAAEQMKKRRAQSKSTTRQNRGKTFLTKHSSLANINILNFFIDPRLRRDYPTELEVRKMEDQRYLNWLINEAQPTSLKNLAYFMQMVDTVQTDIKISQDQESALVAMAGAGERMDEINRMKKMRSQMREKLLEFEAKLERQKKNHRGLQRLQEEYEIRVTSANNDSGYSSPADYRVSKADVTYKEYKEHHNQLSQALSLELSRPPTLVSPLSSPSSTTSAVSTEAATGSSLKTHLVPPGNSRGTIPYTETKPLKPAKYIFDFLLDHSLQGQLTADSARELGNISEKIHPAQNQPTKGNRHRHPLVSYNLIIKNDGTIPDFEHYQRLAAKAVSVLPDRSDPLGKLGVTIASYSIKATFFYLCPGRPSLLSESTSTATATGVQECKYTHYLAYNYSCLLYTSPSPRDRQKSRMPSSA